MTANQKGTGRGRRILRWALAIVGVMAVLVGAVATAAAAWLQGTVDQRGSLTTAAQVIPAAQCQTVLIEVADVSLSAEEWDRYEFIAGRGEESIAVEVPGAQMPYLVGIADSNDVEGRLLGTQYCVAESTPEGWAVVRIAVAEDLPEVSLSGLPGVWGRSGGIEAVVVPLPEAGRTMVVTSDGGSGLGDVRLVGRYRIEGARDIAAIGIIGGPIVIGAGLVALLISIFALRPRGRHEGASS